MKMATESRAMETGLCQPVGCSHLQPKSKDDFTFMPVRFSLPRKTHCKFLAERFCSLKGHTFCCFNISWHHIP